MKREAIVAIIRSEEVALEQAGVKSLAIVGSFARDSHGEGSDVDVLIDASR